MLLLLHHVLHTPVTCLLRLHLCICTAADPVFTKSLEIWESGLEIPEFVLY